MTVGFVIGGFVMAASAVSQYSAARKAAAAYSNDAKYNAEVLLSNGRLNASISRFDAIGPRFQALLEASNADINADIYRLNAAVAETQGEIKANELLLQEKYVLADAATKEAAFEASGQEELQDRTLAGAESDSQMQAVLRGASQVKARARASYAALGIDIDSQALAALDEQVAIDTEQKLGDLTYRRLVEQRASGRRIRDGREAVSDARSISEQEAFSMRTSAKFVELDSAQEARMMKLEEQKMAESGDYMRWYSGFINDSTEIKAQAIETGADIRSDQTFMAGMSQASATKAAGTASAIGALGSSVGFFAQSFK